MRWEIVGKGYRMVKRGEPVVAAAEIFVHEGIRDGWGGWEGLRQFYMARDAANGKTYGAGLIDAVIPTMVLGILCGWATRRARLRVACGCVALVAAGAVFLRLIEDGMEPAGFARMGTGNVVRFSLSTLVFIGGISAGVREIGAD